LLVDPSGEKPMIKLADASPAESKKPNRKPTTALAADLLKEIMMCSLRKYQASSSAENKTQFCRFPSKQSLRHHSPSNR
jgi:hypothetical protein